MTHDTPCYGKEPHAPHDCCAMEGAGPHLHCPGIEPTAPKCARCGHDYQSHLADEADIDIGCGVIGEVVSPGVGDCRCPAFVPEVRE